MTLDDTTVPRLGHGFRLQWEEAQGCHVLLYPEGMVKLNRSAGEILTRCDGDRSLADIVDQLGKPGAAARAATAIASLLNPVNTNQLKATA